MAEPAVIVQESEYGELATGEKVMCIDVSASNVSASFVSYGATLLSVMTPDRDGVAEEVTLHHPHLEGLLSSGYYYGATVGRVANRVANAKFSLDGQEYALAANNGPNSLHGGSRGFDKSVWAHEIYTGDEGDAGVRFTLTSPHGDEGYPGTVSAEVTYSLDTSGALMSRFRATVEGAATPINLTNHAYWNLSGGCRRNVLQHTLRLCASRYLPIDSAQIPTGELAGVQGTPFDHLQARPLSDAIRDVDGGGRPGLDHCFVVDGHYSGGSSVVDKAAEAPQPHSSSTTTAGASEGVEEAKGPGGKAKGERPLLMVAELVDPESGRTLTLRATQPGVQVYTANWVEGSHPHVKHNAVCLETQAFPNAINHPDWAPSVVLRPGHLYEHLARLDFGIAAPHEDEDV